MKICLLLKGNAKGAPFNFMGNNEKMCPSCGSYFHYQHLPFHQASCTG